MDRENRPLGREKTGSSGTGSVKKRGSGLGTGPVGSKEGYSGRPGGTSKPGRPAGMNGGSGNGRRSSGGGKGPGGLLAVVAAIAALIFGGGSMLPDLLGGSGGSLLSELTGSSGSTGMSSEHTLMNSYNGQSNSWGELDGWMDYFGSMLGDSYSSQGSYSSGSSSYGSSSGSSSSYGNSSSGSTSTYGSSSSSYGSSLGEAQDAYSSSEFSYGGTGVLDTDVATGARAKRTKIVGNGKDVVTVMVYMCGTDLESRSSMATYDLQEMASATLGSNVNLLVYTGGCRRWKNNVVSSSTNQIYRIKNGSMELLKDNIGSKNMTDPETLAEFIRWSKGSYPADRYDLILWDHGGGSTSGYGYDEKVGSSSSMTLDKIGDALKAGGCTFDFIGFDACLMATLETALVLEPYADYMIASEETEPGVGWYYTNWLTSLGKNTSISTVELGKTIIDDFVSVCGQKAAGSPTTLSLVDLAELDYVVPDKFREFALSTTELIQSGDYRTVSNARSRSKEFAASTKIDQVDLIDLAERMGTEEGQELAAALQSAVKYNLTSRSVNNAYGLSIYFPYGQMSGVNKMVNTYAKIGLDTSYTDCIKSFASLEAGGQVAAGGSQGQMSSLFDILLGGGSIGSSSGSSSYTMYDSDMVSELLGSFLSGRSMAALGIDEKAEFLDEKLLQDNTEYLIKQRFNTEDLIWSESQGGKVLKLKEEQWDLIQKVELNVFVDDGEGFIDLGLDNSYKFDENGNLIGEYDQTWLSLDDQIVAYYMISAEGNADCYQILGRVPAMLNDERVELILSFTDQNPAGEVLGAQTCYVNGETDTVAKGLTELKRGDRLDFLCDYYDYDQNYSDSYYLGDTLTVQGDLTIGTLTIEDAECVACYRLTDMYDNHYWTPAM